MIKRSESKTASSSRHRINRQKKKRRLMMEGLEKRQLLAVMTELPAQPATDITEYTSARNIGAVQAFGFNESETTVQTGMNDILSAADFVPLGTGAGQQDTVDVTGALPIVTNNTSGSGFSSDIDSFSFDLRGGDILDVATLGAAGGVTIRDANGSILVGSDVFIGSRQFPLMSLGNASSDLVIPADGRYTVTVSPANLNTTGNYTLGLRVYRPTTEELAIGDSQILYLDFGGDLIDNNIFNDALIQANPGLPVGGVTRVRSLLDSLPVLGLQFGDTAAANQIIDSVYNEVIRIYEDLSNSGNGDYEATGNPGDYGLRILNSRDHGGQISLNDPRLTRLLIGGTGTDFGVAGALGIANSVDVGNFDLSEFGIFALDGILTSVTGVPLSPAASQIDIVSQFLASVAAHEAGHTFGMIHTDNTNSIGSLSDTGGTPNADAHDQGLGNDGIFGTLDDEPPIFRDDFYQPGEVPDFGFNKVRASLSHALSTGTVGASVSGVVFDDINGNGSNTGDSGLAGVTVFADINGNSVLDPGEPTTTTNANGGFSLSAASGSVNLVALAPTGFGATTPTTVNTNFGTTSTVNFGFRRNDPALTGRVFVDANGDGFPDDNDPGLAGVYAYIDLDGDNRPDLGEPGANTAADGTYRLNFPGSGPFDIRIVVPPGFEITSPGGGEHNDGVPTRGNFDFGLLASQDFGDAPNSYGTTVAADGARHGITSGLTIGTVIDREAEGQPSAANNGDDINGAVDDEDGVVVLKAIAPGQTVLQAIGVDVTNTSGAPAFLVGFLDIDGNGTFDSDEQIVTDRVIPSGTVNSRQFIDITLPSSGTVIGNTVARFRLSQTAGLGAKGFAETGEVEDHTVSIQLSAELASPDEFTVTRNAGPRQLNVLANDFQSPNNELFIETLDLTGLSPDAGSRIRIDPVAGQPGAKFISYTPPSGFIGREVFTYFVVDEGGNRASAEVVVNVQFQSNVPIALDDSFEVPVGSVNRALNVLDNDVPSVFGGISVSSVSPGSAGGTLTIVGGGRSIRYTPLPGFNGTEQFTYSVQDAVGSTSMATVTINLLPGSRDDDKVAFTIGIFDDVNANTEISNVQVGQEFNLRVFVDDIREVSLDPVGVSSAFIDLLYTDELLSPVLLDNGDLDISFGSVFSSLQLVDFDTPGLLDEVGGVQSLDMPSEQQIDPVTDDPIPFELFTVKMVAIAPGVGVLAADPADEAVSETILLEKDVALTPSEIRLDRAELLITPSTENFTAAIDDSFPAGRDSNGNAIVSTSPSRNVLRVLNNDRFGETGTVNEFGLVTAPTLGNAFIDNNGTPDNLNDDFISYRANANASGLEQFRYVIVTADGIRSTAQVTIALGNQNANADVAFTLDLVSGDGSGAALDASGVSVGDRVGVQITVDDVRRSLEETFVFAAFTDLLYDADVLRPADTNPSDNFDFDVVFESPFLQNPDVATTAFRPGIIDELGSSFASAPTQIGDGEDPTVLGTVFFDVIGTGDAGVVGSPADSFPFSDTLLFQQDEPVGVSLIRFEALDFTVPTSTLQNSALPQDVNADGFVTPIDALLIINQVTRNVEGESPIASRYYTDVNGDFQTSALDALQVINYLQRSSLEAERAVAAPAPSNSTEPAATNTDALFAIDQEDLGKLVSTDVSSSSATNSGVVASQDATNDDDDDDDVLNLLADDVSSLWN